MNNAALGFHAAVKGWGVDAPGASVAACAKQVGEIAANIKTEVVNLFGKQSGFQENDVMVLWEAALGFLKGLPQLANFHQKLTAFETKNAPEGLWPHFVGLEPWGKMLICLPANAVIPLALVLPTALAASGNQIVVAVSSGAREAGLFLLDAIQPALGKKMMIWREGVREAIDCLVGDQPAVDALYYMGASRQFAQIATTCANSGVALLFEGEGRGVVIIDDTLSHSELKSAVKCILAAKTFCLGRMCSAPNAVLISATIFEEFVNIYHHECLAMSLEHYKSLLGTPEVRKVRRELDKQFGSALPNPGGGDELHPFYWIAETNQALSTSELFTPDILLTKLPDIESCFRAVSQIRYRLQISLFSRDQSRLKELISRTRFARYCHWMNPANQDALLPWGNYGCSGTSDVLDFYRKGLRRIIVESGQPMGQLFRK